MKIDQLAWYSHPRCNASINSGLSSSCTLEMSGFQKRINVFGFLISLYHYDLSFDTFPIVLIRVKVFHAHAAVLTGIHQMRDDRVLLARHPADKPIAKVDADCVSPLSREIKQCPVPYQSSFFKQTIKFWQRKTCR